MKNDSSFWAEMQHPDGTRICIEARSYRTVVSQIRFFAATQNARLLTRGPIPENVTYCTRCRDLFVKEDNGHSTVCEQCLEELVDGEESA